ncbi:septum formation family protein [Demequina sp. SYSU T00039]|uniref:Septum formation family protein n=1 Tax=Demequina lignilytica TaxID=3051663 RepID=A0AAW7M7C4_9MICO|nr:MULTISPECIES: septum formation family protein [unclassified Demequina]MDN4478739.1 septum formation family protein [Demequina sp. SYSU T00039-1]MDN4488716.1 septum formation family protein [Demequina sp. SYSU T00039]
MLRPIALASVLALTLAGCSSLFGTTEEDVAAMQLATGQCIEHLDDLSGVADGEEGEVGVLPTVDCAEPHEAEVYYAADTTAAEYTDGILTEADQTCYDAFGTFVGLSYDESRLSLFSLYPSQDTWDAGDRQIACLITGDQGETFTATLAGAAE